MQKAIKLVLVVFTFVSIAISSSNFVNAAAWITKNPYPSVIWQHKVEVVDNKLYALGGTASSPGANNPFASVMEYDPNTDTWTPKSSMNTARQNFTSDVVNGKIYVFGGQGAGGVALSSVEEYDPITDTWTLQASMPATRVFAGSGEIDGKVYVFGGRRAGQGTNTTIVEMFDPVNNTWTTRAPAPSGVWFTEGAVVNGKMHVILLDKHYVYDPVGNSWATLPPNSSEISSATNGASSEFAIGNKIYVLDDSGFFSYDVTLAEWTSLQLLNTPREYLGIGILNGNIYAVGGFIGNVSPQQPQDGVEVYDLNALLPVISVSPSTYDFGYVKTGSASSKTMTISSIGGADLEVSDISISSGSATAFVNDTDFIVELGAGCGSSTPSIIQDGTSCEVIVTFIPSLVPPPVGSSSTTSEANLNITSNAVNSPLSEVSLTGRETDVNIISSFDTPDSNSYSGLTYDGSNLWIASNQGPIYKIDTSGNVLTSFAVPEDPAGLAFDGSNLWYTSTDFDNIYGITTTGSNTATFGTECCDPRGMTYNGNNLAYVNYWLNKVNVINSSGGLINSINVPANPFSLRGLTHDGSSYYVSQQDFSSTGKILQLDASGGIVDSFNTPGPAPYGLTFDGTYFWLLETFPTKIYQLDILTNPILAINPSSIDFGTVAIGGTSTPQTVTVSNTGATDLFINSVSISGTTTSQFSMQAGSSTPFTVQNDNCTGQFVSPGFDCAFDVTFSPQGTSTVTGSAIIISNAGTGTVSLEGTGAGSNLTISPPTGRYGTNQTFDIMLLVDAPGATMVSAIATIDGDDVTDALFGCFTPGTLVTGGQTFRCANIKGGGNGHLSPGIHDVSVTINLSNGESISDSVSWEMLTTIE